MRCLEGVSRWRRFESSYLADNVQFFDGIWNVVEPADMTSGGDGTWYTAFIDGM